MNHRKRPLTGYFAALALFLGTFTAGLVPAVAYAASASTSTTNVMAAPARPLCEDANCIAVRYINPFIKAMSAIAGIAVTISLIYAGIQYSSAGGDPSKIGAAKSRIGKSIGALVMFIFLYAFLNYLIPGGI